MLSTAAQALAVAILIFSGVFAGLRGIEWLYHRIRHTPDWSPHWGSWLFAVLVAIYSFINYLGR